MDFSGHASGAAALRRQLEEEIGREQHLKTEFDKAKLSYEEQRDLVFRIRNSLTAVHRFPPEILSEIFCVYMEDNQDVPLAQLLLTHVCRIWRNVAIINTPSLWTTLYVSLGRSPSFTDHPSMITDWFNRSSLPLSVRIDYSSGKSRLYHYHRKDKAKRLPVEIVAALIPFSARIRALGLYGPLQSLAPMLSLASGFFPILEELDLVFNSHSWKTRNARFTSFANCPLKSLRLHHDDDLHLGFPIFDFNFIEITSCSLEGFGDDPLNVWSGLMGCRNLVECSIAFYCDRIPKFYLFPQHSVYSQATLPNLRKLKLRCRNELELVEFKLLSVLIAPALEDLCLEFITGDPSYNMPIAPALISFQQQSQFSLSHLSLIQADMITNDDLESIMEIFSDTVRSLTIITNKINPNHILGKLCCGHKRATLFPHLEFLRFSMSKESFISFSPNLLLNIAEARWSPENRSRLGISSPPMIVQMDKLVTKSSIRATHGNSSSDDDDDGGPAGDVLSDCQSAAWRFRQSKANENLESWRQGWTAEKINPGEKTRLERLEKEGFRFVEGVYRVVSS
ncbi:hypothetical protein GYMLUDRAFT_39872 [Collybiopsis luxurians FD-317 M1]|nr:hypothetical protein GYMLUDRAFT_39872 [Collybiopsis luxurians FD-317 M1]